MTTYSEERVLKPLDPIPDDVNDWPDFALREVKIFHQGKGRYADLLEAADDVPLCVLGELMPLEDELEHLALIEDPTYVRMKIENVTNYSFGQNDDGKPVIWAAGKAGWYEIGPSDRYLSHYNDTTEAIDMFYFMVDQYSKLGPKRKRLGFLIDPFLKEYQKHTDYRVDDDDEAMEILHKHHKFLLKQMIEERENIDWSQTHLWKHLAATYADEIQNIQQQIASQAETDVQMQDSVSDEVEQSEEESENEETSETDETEEEDAQTSNGIVESASDSSDDELLSSDWTKPIWSLLNILRKSPTFDIKTAGIEDVAREVQKMPKFPGNHKAAIGILERLAEPLLRLMNEAKLRKKFNWSTRAIYAELEATLADEVAEDIRTPAQRSKKKHRLKSVLRPSGASKANKRASSMATIEDSEGKDDDDDDDDDEEEDADEIVQDEIHTAKDSSMDRRQQLLNGRRAGSVDSGGSRMDSPSRQLNGHFDVNELPELPPAPEAQEMLDLVRVEAKKHGRVNQIHHLEALLGRYNGEFM